MIKQCSECGTDFECQAPGHRRLTCSDKCQYARNMRRQKERRRSSGIPEFSKGPTSRQAMKRKQGKCERCGQMAKLGSWGKCKKCMEILDNQTADWPGRVCG